jgi:hypothetical protein
MIDTAAEIRTILNFYEDKGGYTSNSKVGDYVRMDDTENFDRYKVYTLVQNEDNNSCSCLNTKHKNTKKYKKLPKLASIIEETWNVKKRMFLECRLLFFR